MTVLGSRRLVASAFVLLALLSGCTDNAEPKPLPTPSPSTPSPSPSPSVSAPTLPAEAQGVSAKSAEAFVRYYVETINYASATGHTAQLQSASDERCVSCAAVQSAIETVYTTGSRLEGEGWVVGAVEPVPQQPRTRPVLQTSIRISPQTRISKDGHHQTRSGGRQLMIFTLHRGADNWLVAKLERSR